MAKTLRIQMGSYMTRVWKEPPPVRHETAYDRGVRDARHSWCEGERLSEKLILSWSAACAPGDRDAYIAGARDENARMWTPRCDLARARRKLAREGTRGRRGTRPISPSVAEALVFPGRAER